MWVEEVDSQRPSRFSSLATMLALPQLFTLAVTGILTLSGVQAYPNPGTVKGAITGVHDPSVAKGGDGTYVLVSTGRFSLRTRSSLNPMLTSLLHSS